MKNLPIKSQQFRYIEKSFKEWLDILGYAETTVNSLPIHVRELLHYIEQEGITGVQGITPKHITAFLRHLLTRQNQRTGAGLSTSSINKTIQAINTFIKYLRTAGKLEIDIATRTLEPCSQPRIILTKEEIQALYEATYITTRSAGREYGQRDRAMLSIFYGCGLRRNEARHLDLKDIQTTKNIIHVRKGKGSKERLVPLTPGNMEYIDTYIEESRSLFLEKKTNNKEAAFFISRKGKRMQGFYQRIALLKQTAGIDKPLGLHTLRHSIATHLLHAGMEIEDIARFLGHSTLESTQIYTHVSAEVQRTKEDILDEYGEQL